MKDKIFGIFKFNLENINDIKFLKRFCGFFIHSKFARKLYRERLNLISKLNKIKEYNDILKDKILRGYAICVLPASLGDSMLFFEFKEEIEKYHNLKCFPILRKSHSVIPVLYGEDDYLILENVYDLLELPIVKALYYGVDDIFKISDMTPYPQKQRLFFAHTEWIPSRNNTFAPLGYENYFIEYAKFLYNIPKEALLNGKLNLNRIEPINKSKNIVFLAPESSTLSIHKAIQDTFWLNLADYYSKKGFEVVYNSKEEIKSLTGHAKWLDCSLEDALKTAVVSDKIISTRSGICDLLHNLGDKLCVIYPSEDLMKKFSLNDMFPSNNIKEIVYNSGITPDNLYK